MRARGDRSQCSFHCSAGLLVSDRLVERSNGRPHPADGDADDGDADTGG